MNNTELKEIINSIVLDEDECNNIIVLEGDEFANGAVGLSYDNHVIYSYNKIVESLMAYNNWSEDEAIEWIDYNTMRSLPYMISEGKEPIIMRDVFEDYL